MTSSVTNFFLDTEFTNLPWDGNSELVWIALVDETGTREFSVVNADCALDACSPFVRRHVLPQLDRAHARLPREELTATLARFLSGASNPRLWSWWPSVADVSFLTDATRAPELHTRFADWDYQLARTLLDNASPELRTTRGDVHVLADTLRVELPSNVNPHNPLADARWTRDVWLQAHEKAR